MIEPACGGYVTICKPPFRGDRRIEVTRCHGRLPGEDADLATPAGATGATGAECLADTAAAAATTACTAITARGTSDVRCDGTATSAATGAGGFRRAGCACSTCCR